MPLLFKRLQKSDKNSAMQSWQQIEINNQILSRINYHLLKSKDMTTFEILKFSLTVRLRGHKQKKWINMVVQFLLFVSSKPRCQAEF